MQSSISASPLTPSDSLLIGIRVPVVFGLSSATIVDFGASQPVYAGATESSSSVDNPAFFVLRLMKAPGGARRRPARVIV